MMDMNVRVQYEKMALLKMSYMCYLGVMHTTKIEKLLVRTLRERELPANTSSVAPTA